MGGACVKMFIVTFFGCGWLPEGVCIWGCVCQLVVLLVFVCRLIVCIPCIYEGPFETKTFLYTM